MLRGMGTPMASMMVGVRQKGTGVVVGLLSGAKVNQAKPVASFFVSNSQREFSTAKDSHPADGFFQDRAGKPAPHSELSLDNLELGKGGYMASHGDYRVREGYGGKYKLDYLKDPHVPSRESEHWRLSKRATALVGSGIGTLIMAKQIFKGIVMFRTPGRDLLALSSIEIDLAKIPEGKSMTFSWQRKPIFVFHRTPAQIAAAEATNLSELRHPEHDDARALIDKKWLVVIGICTHLGCIPLAGKGDYGGYYCPCHGSHYDTAGRVRKGPAPENLPLPNYRIEGNTCVVG